MRPNTGAVVAVATCAALSLSLPTRASADQPGDEIIESEEHHFQLQLSGAWKRVTPAPGPENVVAGYENRETGQFLAITRVGFPNTDAWRKKKEFFAQVEAGFADAATGYRKLRRRRTRLGKVPAMDLWFRRQRGRASETAMVRVLFFRTYSLSLTIVGPTESHRRVTRATRKILAGFRPFFGK